MVVKRWRSISAGVIVESQVRAIPIGTPVEIRLTDKTKFRGHLYAVEVSGSNLVQACEIDKSGAAFAYSGGSLDRGGTIVAVAVIAVAVFAIERHNE